jgi:hypothetical protein
MAIHGSGSAIYISHIKSEHGETSGADYLGEYFRKGRNSKPVPDNDKNDAIPKSGIIWYEDFYGSIGTYSSYQSGNLVFTTGKIASGTSQNWSPSTMWKGTQSSIAIGGASGAQNQSITLSIVGRRPKNYFGRFFFNGNIYNAASANHMADPTTRWTWANAGSPVSAGANGFWLYE